MLELLTLLANKVKKLAIKVEAKLIPEGADLNNYRVEGDYYCETNVNAATLLNCPTDKSFALSVRKTNSYGCVQKIVLYHPSYRQTYIRRIYQNEIGEWESENVMADLFFSDKTLTRDGLSITSNRVSITAGGYRLIGKICQVQLMLNVETTMSANDYWTLFSGGFPTPATTYAALAAQQYASTAPMNAHIGFNSLQITIGNRNLTKGDILFISGTYIAA